MMDEAYFKTEEGTNFVKDLLSRNLDLLDAWNELKKTPDLISLKFVGIDGVKRVYVQEDGTYTGRAGVMTRVEAPGGFSGKKPISNSVSFETDFVMAADGTMKSFKYNEAATRAEFFSRGIGM